MAHKPTKRGILKKYVGMGGPGKNARVPEFVDTTYLKGNGKSGERGSVPGLSPSRPEVPPGLSKPGQAMRPEVPPMIPQVSTQGKNETGSFTADDYLKAQRFAEKKGLPSRPTNLPSIAEPKGEIQPLSGGYSQSTPAMTTSPAAIFSQTRKTPDQAQAAASPMFQQKRKMLKSKLSQLTGIPQMK